MIDFKNRGSQKELLDGDEIPYDAIEQNMRELNTINTLLGGHAITLKGVDVLLPPDKTAAFTVCEIGCGGGDNLQAVARHLKKKGELVNIIGIDIKKECLATAQKNYGSLKASWLQSDYKEVVFKEKPSIIFSSLFCHHFMEEDLVFQLKWMNENSTNGFFINDLHRHPLAYYSIKFITKLFSKSYLVKNDAPISVLRGFTKREWIAILKKAEIKEYAIQWKWAFRYLIVVKKEAK